MLYVELYYNLDKKDELNNSLTYFLSHSHHNHPIQNELHNYYSFCPVVLPTTVPHSLPQTPYKEYEIQIFIQLKVQLQNVCVCYPFNSISTESAVTIIQFPFKIKKSLLQQFQLNVWKSSPHCYNVVIKDKI